MSDPNVFVPGGMDVDQRLSDARMSERVSSMDPAVLGTLLNHSEKVKQQVIVSGRFACVDFVATACKRVRCSANE